MNNPALDSMSSGLSLLFRGFSWGVQSFFHQNLHYFANSSLISMKKKFNWLTGHALNWEINVFVLQEKVPQVFRKFSEINKYGVTASVCNPEKRKILWFYFAPVWKKARGCIEHCFSQAKLFNLPTSLFEPCCHFRWCAPCTRSASLFTQIWVSTTCCGMTTRYGL